MNNNITIVQGHADPLLEQYNALAFTQNIPDMEIYASDWHALGDECIKQGRPALAGMCYARSYYYGQIGKGEYVRLLEQPFAELIEVTA